jgi:hypothetical protein
LEIGVEVRQAIAQVVERKQVQKVEEMNLSRNSTP